VAGNVRFNLPFTLGMGDLPPDGLDPKIKPLMDQIWNAFVQVQLAFHNYAGVGQQLQSLWPALVPSQTLHLSSNTRWYGPCSENIGFGAAINLFDNAGVLTARNANATNNTKPAHGFCTVTGGILAGASLEAILFRGLLTGFVGLTRGARYFLSTSNGQVTAVAPVAAGNIEQAVGLALDTTTLLYDFNLWFLQH
jgi:hypothetical protein